MNKTSLNDLSVFNRRPKKLKSNVKLEIIPNLLEAPRRRLENNKECKKYNLPETIKEDLDKLQIAISKVYSKKKSLKISHINNYSNNMNLTPKT
jgi:hypothetical protein